MGDTDSAGDPWGGSGVAVETDPNEVGSGANGADSSSLSGLGGIAMGGGLGILSAIGQENAYQALMKESETYTKNSPWTKMQFKQPTAPNELGTVTGLAASGGAQGQGSSGGGAGAGLGALLAM